MADVGMVHADGWISDESDFYGDDATRQALESRATMDMRESHGITSVQPRKTSVSKPTSKPKRAVTSNEDVLQFLKSRPQIKRLFNAASSTDPKSLQEQAIQSRDGGQPEDVPNASEVENEFDGDPAEWKRTETVSEFLKRAPVSNPANARFGPWLWVRNPRKHKERSPDIEAFVAGGRSLLDTFTKRRMNKMRPSKDLLEDDLLTLAVKTNATCGKWMFFPDLNDLDRYWRLVAEATADGDLGPTSKVATYDRTDPKRLICVYTYDFTDMADVRRVLEKLIDLGLCRSDGRPIYYKCDAYTYLDIASGNPYSLRASLYSSKEVLKHEVTVSMNGSISRLKKNYVSAGGALES